MAVMIDMHTRFDLPTAIRIVKGCEPYNLTWIEEPVPAENMEAMREITASSNTPICAGENLFLIYQFENLLEKKAADIIMPDMAWTGGISETRKICALADTYYLPVTSHDCIGPVALWSAVHMMLHVPNAMIVETVRAYYEGWYNDIVTDQILIQDGMITLSGKPGLGTALREEVLQRPDVHIEVSDLSKV